MKSLHLLTLLIGCVCLSQAQVTGAAPTTDAGLSAAARSGNPILNRVMQELRNSNKNQHQYIGETVGSPYHNTDFTPSKVYYEDDFIGDFFVRYNALNSEIEIKETNNKEESHKALLVDKKIKVMYQGKEMGFMTFINKKNRTKNGYLSTLVEGKKYTLYHRLAIKYTEGKAAANSMLNPIPSRFTHFIEYYYSIKGIPRINQLGLKKKAFLKGLDNDIRESVKSFLKENKIDLGQEADLVKTFNYINSLN